MRGPALAVGLMMAVAASARAQEVPIGPKANAAWSVLKSGDRRGATELERLAAEGDADAQFLIGSMAFSGEEGY
ncbi:MAG TPA: hypothetical protein PLF78_03420, partial [Caulobacter sp.]|nr:hypothetical protein [Caulobacter sp.]